MKQSLSFPLAKFCAVLAARAWHKSFKSLSQFCDLIKIIASMCFEVGKLDQSDHCNFILYLSNT